uniref:Uncharacterized protein n=1 Tax=Tanacetum cinerariifolium TaxID=118510 RepID=A0A699JFW7_TANCI|nr:hypothetical protein [Tanacetum cinerariifolium]
MRVLTPNKPKGTCDGTLYLTQRPRSEGTSSEEMEFKAARLIPAQKCLPLPDKMMTETFGFSSSEDKARGNSLKKASESALWRVGLFRCKVNTDGLLVSSCMISKEVYDEDDIFAAGPMLSSTCFFLYVFSMVLTFNSYIKFD